LLYNLDTYYAAGVTAAAAAAAGSGAVRVISVWQHQAMLHLELAGAVLFADSWQQLGACTVDNR